MSMSIHFWTAKLFPIFMSAENIYKKLILRLHHWHRGLAVLKPLSFSRIFTSAYRFYILITISNYLNHKAIDLDIPGMVSLFKSRLSNHYGYGRMLNPITSKSFNPINPIKIKRHWELIILKFRYKWVIRVLLLPHPFEHKSILQLQFNPSVLWVLCRNS